MAVLLFGTDPVLVLAWPRLWRQLADALARSMITDMVRVALCCLWIVAAAYGYGALVHVLNIVGATGIDWLTAPRKWQVLDVGYFVLDVAVLVALPRRRWLGIAAFYAAACSQLFLYTFGRAWILDVPAAFQRPPEEIAYLDTLVAFHVVTLGVVSAALWVLRRR